MGLETSKRIPICNTSCLDVTHASSEYDCLSRYVCGIGCHADPKEIIEDDRVTGYVISNDLEQSTSFIHGNSLIVAMKRQDYEDTIESETLRLRYCDIAL